MRSRLHRLRPLAPERGLRFLSIFVIAKLPSQSARRWLYRKGGLELGRHAIVHMGAELRSLTQISIGDGTIIGFDCILDGRGGIDIGKNVNVSSEAAIWTMQHDHRDPYFSVVSAPVTVGDRAWLSFRTTVLPGVTIGEGAVICAGAVVVSDVPPYAIVAGIPARQIGERPRDLRYEGGPSGVWFI